MTPERSRTSVPIMAFWCMVEVIIFLLAAFVRTHTANDQFIHTAML